MLPINVAVADLVAARSLCQDNGGKRPRKSDSCYRQVIASLQSVGVNLSYEAMKKRVKRASLENRATTETEILRLNNLSEQSVVSSLTSPSLTSDDRGETAPTPEQQSNIPVG